MSVYACTRIDDAASYVLRAMDDGDWQEYALHLRVCTDCADKTAELSFVTDALLSGVPQVMAPPELRERVMGPIRAEPNLGRPAPAVSGRQPRRRRFALNPAPAAALATVLLALGIGGGVLLTGGGSGASRTVLAQAASGSAQLRIEDRGATLVVDGLRAPPDGRIYQVWLAYPGEGRPPEPTDALFGVSSTGRATVDVPGRLDEVSAVLVTDEPLGGSSSPTGRQVIAARLT